MKTVRRFWQNEYSHQMEESTDGDYVLFSDYQELETDLEAWKLSHATIEGMRKEQTEYHRTLRSAYEESQSKVRDLVAIIKKQDEALKFYEIGDRMFDDREWDYHDGRLVPVGEYGTKAGDARARTEIELKRLGVL